MGIMRQSACLNVNSIAVYSYGFLAWINRGSTGGYLLLNFCLGIFQGQIEKL